jgi:transcriptional regulator with XRE-family HTH domain
MSALERNDAVATRLGEALRRTRALVDVSQSELARRLGVSPQYVNRWEAGGRRIDPETVEQAERLLGVRRGTVWRLAGFVEDEGLVDLDLLGVEAARIVRAVIRELDPVDDCGSGSA